MNNHLNVKYASQGSYEIFIETNLDKLPESINKIVGDKAVKALIISDNNVSKLYLETVVNTLKDSFTECVTLIIEPGEASKNLSNVKKCYDCLKENDFHRSDMIIALGGGVVGDLSGFVAATYMRGIKFVQMPTSLLAMADSSIGGKCAVDLDGYKNTIGSIFMPSLVYENVNFLNTLPDREFACGMAEILKAGLIKNGPFYEWLINNFELIESKDLDSIVYMLGEADEVKRRVVENDPFEHDERMHLNFGHTIGHAIEKSSSFGYNHGESVALGMIAAAYISWKRNYLSMEEYYEIRDMFVPFELPISTDPFDIEPIFDAIKLDKKKINGKLNFILLKKIGKAITVSDVTDDEIKNAINELIVELD